MSQRSDFNDAECRQMALQVIEEHGRAVRAESKDGPIGGYALNIYHFRMHAGMLDSDNWETAYQKAAHGLGLLIKEGRIEWFGATDIRLIPEDELNR